MITVECSSLNVTRYPLKKIQNLFFFFTLFSFAMFSFTQACCGKSVPPVCLLSRSQQAMINTETVCVLIKVQSTHLSEAGVLSSCHIYSSAYKLIFYLLSLTINTSKKM